MRMKIKKKIVMLLPNLQTGGAEKVSLLILNNLSDDLFEKHLILFQKKGKNLNNVNKNINIINLDNPRLIFNSIKIINIILKYKFDVVFYTSALCAAIYKIHTDDIIPRPALAEGVQVFPLG